MSHSTMSPIVELPEVTTDGTTLQQLLNIATPHVGDGATLDLGFELVTHMHCTECEHIEPKFTRMARLYEDEANCPQCGGQRDMKLTNRITGNEDFLDRTLADMDIPPLGIVRAKNGKERVYLELTGDKETFLQFE